MPVVRRGDDDAVDIFAPEHLAEIVDGRAAAVGSRLHLLGVMAFHGLAGALAAMRPRERDALLLYALADLSYEEVSVAIGTVRTWVHRARTTAQRELTDAEVNVSPLAATGVDLNGST